MNNNSHSQPIPSNDNQLQEPAKFGANTSRRTVLFAGALAGTAGVIGGNLFRAAPASAAETTTSGVRTFVSTPLTMPQLTVKKSGTTAPGYLFISPEGDIPVGLITDDAGEPVYILQREGMDIADLRTQTLYGQPVTTDWEGVGAAGHGNGVIYFRDSTYNVRYQIPTSGTPGIDFHESHITPESTLLGLVDITRQVDLTSVGGPANGYARDCVIREIDPTTGAILFEWSSIDHLDLTESYETPNAASSSPNTPYDPFHINSIESNGNTLLLSSRHTHTLYQIDRTTGVIQWRMNGKNSDFAVDSAAVFSWQHDARWQDSKTISLFDNQTNVVTTTGTPSRGLVLNVDTAAMTVSMKSEYRDETNYYANAQGSMQLLDNGNALVGWGFGAALTEFDSAGQPVLQIGNIGSSNYRASRGLWTGVPTTSPDLGVLSGGTGILKVYASWNGSTEVARWQVWTGPNQAQLTLAATVTRQGFETSTSVPRQAYVQVRALDANGVLLGSSLVQAAPAE